MERRGTFDTVAELYDRARPTYPPELIDDVAALGARVLEIGPGTGQATRALVERGLDVTAVELGPNLAALARRNVPEAQIVNADFETWEPERADFDVVVSFTAFHWLDPDVKYAKSASLLRPGGTLAVAEVDHVLVEGGDPFWVEVQADFDAVVPSPDNRPPPYEHEIGDLREQMEESGLFADVEVRRYRWDVEYTADEWIEVMRTYSPVIALDPETRERLLDRVHARVGARKVRHRYLATVNLARTIVPPRGEKLG
jgi:SAM-dependent methyltransferase